MNNEEVKSLVEESNWVKPATIGLGSFIIKLKNAFGRKSETFSKGQQVKFYYDNIGGTRLQFHGRIDHIKEVMSKDGQFLDITGRHRSYLLTETKVNFSATNADPAQILKDIIDQLPSSYGFTYDNVESTGLTMSVEWNYIDFWDCVRELCEFAISDCRVDNDLDFHFHAQNSKINNEEFIAERVNHLETEEYGVDDYYERNRVIGVGEDENGIPVIYTAISSGEGTEIREVIVRSATANTRAKVQALAEAKLSVLENLPPQALLKSHGLATLEPGEVMWVSVPRQRIYAQLKALQVTIKFGSKEGGIRYETVIEKEIIGTEQLIEARIKAEDKVSKATNVNKLNYSLNFEFNNDNDTESHAQTHVNDGFLSLSDAAFNNGIWIGNAVAAANNISKVELRYFGSDLGSSNFYFSVDNGVNWEPFSGKEILISPVNTGKNIKLKIELIKTDLYPNPKVASGGILFS